MHIVITAKWRKKPTCPIVRYYLFVNMKKAFFKNFENFQKMKENSYNDNFFRSGDQEKKTVNIYEKQFSGLVALWAQLSLLKVARESKKFDINIGF